MSEDLVIGLDAGGTEIKAGLLRGAEVIEERRFFTERNQGPDHAVEQVLHAAEVMHKDFPESKAIGLVVPGVVDSANGIAEFSENIQWKNVPFGSELRRVTGLPWGFGHDVRLGGLAESLYGASAGYRDSLFFPIGTGIAGAMIVDGELIDNPYGGEIGHLDVQSGYNCACGSHGCLESIATAPSIIRIYKEKSGKDVTGSQDVLAAAKAGEKAAREAWFGAMRAIAVSVTAYVTIMAPEIIVFGGGVSNAGDDLIKPVADYVDAHLTFQKRPKFAIAKLGDRAGMIGAGILAQRSLS